MRPGVRWTSAAGGRTRGHAGLRRRAGDRPDTPAAKALRAGHDGSAGSAKSAPRRSAFARAARSRRAPASHAFRKSAPLTIAWLRSVPRRSARLRFAPVKNTRESRAAVHRTRRCARAARPVRTPSPGACPPRPGNVRALETARRARGTTTGPGSTSAPEATGTYSSDATGPRGELAFYLCWSPTEVPLSEVVPVAGVRWSVEERFQAAKGQVGLDHYRRRTVDEPTGQLTKPHWSTNGVLLVRNAMRLCPSRRARPSLVPRSSTPTA